MGAGPCSKLEFEVYHKKSITALDAPSGVYEGGVPLIIDVKVTINSGTSLDLDLNVKIIKDEVKCAGEATATSATDITFPNSGNTGDCMGDSLRNQHKDPSKVKLSINSDGSLTFHSPWPNLKLKKKSFFDAPSGVYEGGVPMIIDVKVTINSGTSLDLDLNLRSSRMKSNAPVKLLPRAPLISHSPTVVTPETAWATLCVTSTRTPRKLS